MIESLIDKLSRYIKVENILENTKTADHLTTILYFRNKEVFRHTLDLEPLYQSFKNRLDSE